MLATATTNHDVVMQMQPSCAGNRGFEVIAYADGYGVALLV